MSRGKAVEAGGLSIQYLHDTGPGYFSFLFCENEQFPSHRSRMLDDGRPPIEKSEKGRLSNC